MVVNTLLWVNKRTEDNDQNTVSAQTNAIFSLQRFHGLEKITEGIKLYALKKSQRFYHSASMNRQQKMTKNKNKWKT